MDRFVPEKFRYFATDLKRCDEGIGVPLERQGFWRKADRIEQEMKTEASTADHIADVKAMVAGQIPLIEKYFSGVISKEDEGLDVESADEESSDERGPLRDDPQQKRLVRLFADRVDLAMAANHGKREAN